MTRQKGYGFHLAGFDVFGISLDPRPDDECIFGDRLNPGQNRFHEPADSIFVFSLPQLADAGCGLGAEPVGPEMPDTIDSRIPFHKSFPICFESIPQASGNG